MTTHHRLRQILLTNATTSGLGGLAALVAAGPVDDLLGTDAPGWVRLVGAGLVAFAASVVLVARSDAPALTRDARLVSLGDASWVLGTVATITLGWYSTSGVIVMAAVGAMVATFGALQWHWSATPTPVRA
ncbi:MAG: hypothetical protein AAGA99_01225 [Actinomycetota bacterium]